MGLDTLQNGIAATIQANPVATTLGAAGAGVALGLGTAAVVGAVKRRKTKRSKARSSRKRSSSNKRRRYTPHTAGKRKDRSTKRIRYTKNGQPYIIMASGKARFISKRGTKMSRKRKGGRY